MRRNIRAALLGVYTVKFLSVSFQSVSKNPSMSGLTKEELKSALVNHGFSLPPARAKWATIWLCSYVIKVSVTHTCIHSLPYPFLAVILHHWVPVSFILSFSTELLIKGVSLLYYFITSHVSIPLNVGQLWTVKSLIASLQQVIKFLQQLLYFIKNFKPVKKIHLQELDEGLESLV